MRRPLVPRTMPDAQNDHAIAYYPIAKNIRPYRRPLTPSVAYVATSIRKDREAVCHRDKPRAQCIGSDGIERGDIGNDRFQIGDGIFRPDDAQLIADARSG